MAFDRQDGPPFEPDDLRSLIAEEHPGGWEGYCREQQVERLRSEHESRSPWRRLEKRIENLACEAGIEPETARKIVEDRLATEIAEAVVVEFRRHSGLGTGRNRKTDNQTNGQLSDDRGELQRVVSPYLNAKQAATYLGKSPKAIYSLVEARKLRKMPGSRIYYFTKEMLDDYLKGETTDGRSLRPGRRAKG